MNLKFEFNFQEEKYHSNVQNTKYPNFYIDMKDLAETW